MSQSDDAGTAAAEFFRERAPQWLAAVGRRHSRRAFDGRPVEPSLLGAVDECCRRFRPHSGARTVLVEAPETDIFTGLVGAYGKVTRAPHVIVVIADERDPFAAQHAGFTGEAAILEATRLGLDTCWVGGFFSRSKVRRLVTLATNERVYCVSPLGPARASKTLAEKTMSALARSGRRKCIAELAPDVSDSWPTWAVAAVETARLAPSAVNRQPWRFRLEASALIISTDRSIDTPHVAKRLDCGIAMLHVELGAAAAGVVGTWTDLAGADVARFDVA